MNTSTLSSVLMWLAPALVACAFVTVHQDQPAADSGESMKEQVIQVHYLEIVTPDVDETCEALEKLHGVKFAEPEAAFGNARIVARAGGGMIGVRAPMREDEAPVVRPYLLVEDVESAVETAKAAGGKIALPPTEIPERGTFAIYLHGGIQYGLWQI